MPWEKYRKGYQEQIGHYNNKNGNHQISFFIGISIPLLFVFPKDFPVTFIHNKNLVKNECREQVYGCGKYRCHWF